MQTEQPGTETVKAATIVFFWIVFFLSFFLMQKDGLFYTLIRWIIWAAALVPYICREQIARLATTHGRKGNREK